MSKYDWLMGWALQFTGSNRAAAEDLVQDTFVRFVLSQAEKPEIEDAEHAEPLLYRYLKYAHLTQLRNMARARIQLLHSSDFDSLQLSLHTNRGADPIEVQHDLRRITAYLSWRKESAKTASVLVLRFIHGYLPTEIMRIAAITRRATDISIAKAREEAKRHIAHPERLRVMHLGTPPDVPLRSFAVSSEQFIHEVKQMIFESRSSQCLSEAHLLQHYHSPALHPIDCELLAHLVSCERCLGIVRSANNIPPRPASFEDHITDNGKRARTDRKSNRSSTRDTGKLLESAQVRLREVYEHRPKKLIVALGGQMLATQDIFSATSKLEIETPSVPHLEFIEILSDQGLCLLAMSIQGAPPDAPPQIYRKVSLSNGRELEVRVGFGSTGPVLEITYYDPLLSISPQQEWNNLAIADDDFLSSLSETPLDPGQSAPATKTPSLLQRLMARLTLFPALVVTITVCTLLAVGALIHIIRHRQAAGRLTPATLLEKASTSDQALLANVGAVVVRQNVQFSTPTMTFTRTSYRDAKGQRHPKHNDLAGDRKRLLERLAPAGVDVDDPLSSAGYQAWHDRQKTVQDTVHQTADVFHLVTSVPDGEVVEESLTIRKSDYHTIERTVEFRNAGTVEIAELEYDTVPWSPASAAWFEPDTAPASPLSRNRPALTLPSRSHSPLAESELDEIELEVLLTLTRLNAYTSERIHLTRNENGIEVKGIVANADRKHEINSQLTLIPHATSTILSFDDLEHASAPESPPKVITQSTDTSQPSLLENYLVSRGMDYNDISALSQRLLNASHAVNRHSTAIFDLYKRFYNGRPLTDAGRVALERLLADQRMKLLVALQEEERQLQDTGIPLPTSGAHGQVSIEDLSTAGEQQLTLCVMLAAGKSQQGQTPEEIARDLDNSLDLLRRATDIVPANPSIDSGKGSTLTSSAPPQE